MNKKRQKYISNLDALINKRGFKHSFKEIKSSLIVKDFKLVSATTEVFLFCRKFM